MSKELHPVVEAVAITLIVLGAAAIAAFLYLAATLPD